MPIRRSIFLIPACLIILDFHPRLFLSITREVASIGMATAWCEELVPLQQDVRIDLIERMPVELLLHTLGQSYGVNIIVTPEVKGDAPILSLKNLTFEEALDVITKSLGLSWEKIGGAFIVKKPPVSPPEPDVTEMFSTRYLDPESMYAIAVEFVKEKEKVVLMREASAVMITAPRSVVARIQEILAKIDTEDAVNIANTITTEQYSPKYFTLASFTDGIKPLLAGDRITWAISEKSRTLTVTAPLKVHKKITTFLQERDKETLPDTIKKEPTPQVLIESQFVEFKGDSSRSFGVAWEATRISGSAYTPFTPGTKTTMSGSAGEILVGLIKTTENLSFNATLDTYIKDGKAKILVAPKSAAMNNETATFKYNRTYNWWKGTPYFDYDGKLNRIVYELGEPVNVEVLLEITPDIDMENRTVTVNVHPKVQDVIDFVSQPDAPTVKVPNTMSQETTTKLRVHDGDIIAIGGLKREKTENTSNRIPVLGQIPLLGYLFRHTADSSERNDLVIFLTVKIMDEKTTALETKTSQAVMPAPLPKSEGNSSQTPVSLQK